MERPKIGEKYIHFKGGEYKIVAVAKDCDEPLREYVIYESLYDSEDFPKGTIWMRSLENFCGHKEINGTKIKRFVKI